MLIDSIPTKLIEFLPDFVEKIKTDNSCIDDDFPHISQTIIYLWGSVECMEYMDGLINYSVTTERPESRQGFPFKAINEITVLMHMHDEKFPFIGSTFRTRKEHNIWGGRI